MQNTRSTTPPRAALYARVSTTGKGQDIGLQLDALRAVATQRGWEVVGEFTDDGVSGTKDSRPGLDALMHAVHAGQVTTVAVWRFDRFGRSLQHLVRALAEFQALGVDFVSVTESVDTSTPMGRVVFHIVGALAEFEVELTRERIAAGVARARKAGKPFGRPRLDIDMDRVNRLLKHGHSLRAVAQLLDIPRSTLRNRLKAAGQKSTGSSGGGRPLNS